MVLAEAQQLGIRELSQVYAINRAAQLCLSDELIAEKTNLITVDSVAAGRPEFGRADFEPEEIDKLEAALSYIALFGERPDAIEAAEILDHGLMKEVDEATEEVVAKLVQQGLVDPNEPFPVPKNRPKGSLDKVDFRQDLLGRLRIAELMDEEQDPPTGELQRVA